jgi:DNA-binding NtrC family response regulator
MFAEQAPRNQQFGTAEEVVRRDAQLATQTRRLAVGIAQADPAKDHPIAQAVQVLSLGSEAHERKIRQAATLASLPVFTALSVWEAMNEIRSNRCQIVMVELPYGDLDAAELISTVRAHDRDIMVIFHLPAAGVADATRLARMGAYSCVDAGMNEYQVAQVLGQARDEATSRREMKFEGQPWRRTLVGQSAAMQEVVRTIELLACRRCTVLITGETGTGKEVAARAVHMASDRASKPFVALNCSAIPEHLLEAELFGHTKGAFTGAINDRAGRFEEADGGTLFLDEIGDMPYDLQAKLLRVLQEREIQRLGSSKTVQVNVRVIAATNLDLLERVSQRQFREDLYYRLNVVPLKMPALADRRHDVTLLARHFVAKICRLEGIPVKEIYNETLEHLTSYAWPGNVRQLENLVERAVVISGDRTYLVPADFPLPSGGSLRLVPNRNSEPFLAIPEVGLDFQQAVSQFEKSLLDQALERANGNKTVAADLLRLKRTTLVSKLRVM